MIFERMAIPDVVLVRPQVFADERGFFMETYHAEKFRSAGLDVQFVQDNHSASSQWILRGLHYQIQQPQGKLVRAIEGEIFDVAVDLRKTSESFGQWVGVYLSSENKHQLYVPPGFAHGFLVTSNTAQVQYKCTELYAPEFERTLAWDDRTVGIEWPLPDGVAPKLSAKDKKGFGLAHAEVYA